MFSWIRKRLTLMIRMFIPVEGGMGQYIWVVDKDVDGKVKKEKQYGVRYVPLTDPPKS